jgi:hypothetical protein
MIPLAQSPDAFGSTIFCDDIRTEVDGKYSFIGVYPGGLRVPTFPTVLPKFGIGVSFWQRRSAFRVQLSFRVYFPGDEDEKPSVEAKLEAEGTPEELASSIPEGPAANEGFIVMRANIILTGMLLKAPGALKSRVLRDGVLVPIGSLPIQDSSKPTPEGSALNTA